MDEGIFPPVGKYKWRHYFRSEELEEGLIYINNSLEKTEKCQVEILESDS